MNIDPATPLPATTPAQAGTQAPPWRSLQARDGTTLRYRLLDSQDSDSGLVILLHGAASNGTRWWHFVEHSQLRGRMRLLHPDLRGHGGSLWRGPAGMDHWCRDLLDLLDAMNVQRAHLVGHCLGANLAVHFAASHPQRCASLVLVEPMLAPALRGSLRRVRRYAPLLRLLVAVLAAMNRCGIYRRRLASVDLRALDQQVQQAEHGEQLMRRRYASPWQDLRVLPSAQYLQNLLEVLKPLPLSALRCPCLALLSAGQLMADNAITREALASLPQIRIEALDAEHWIPTEQPEALCRLIDEWVGGLCAYGRKGSDR